MDWNRGFGLNLEAALNGEYRLARHLSDMEGYYADGAETARLIAEGNPLVYEYLELGAPENAGDIAFGVTKLYPGTVGGEFFMTKGHFHEITDTAEAYFCLSGEGILVTENEAGDVSNIPLTPMAAGYVAKGYAHRVVNTGSSPLLFFYAYRADAGHRYGTIRETGFRTRVFAGAEQPELVIR